MKKKISFILTGGLCLVLLFIAFYLLLSPSSKQAIRFTTQTAQVGEIANSITATGTIEPVTEVEVGTQVSGIIAKIYVDYNSIVKKGQIIAEMDKVNLSNELQSAQSAYIGAKAEYDYQSSLYKRNRQLHEKQLISDTEYETSVYNYEKAKSSFEQTKATLAKAQRNLSYATITSPIDGIVTSKSVEEGQTVASGFSTPTLFTIAADLTKMQVVADVDEADIADIKVGNKVTFTVDAYPDDVFEGKVTQVRLGSTNSSSSSTSTTSESVVTYEVVISANNNDLKLKPRLTANTTIFTQQKPHTLVVPNKALHFQPNPATIGNKQLIDTKAAHKVWVEDGNKIKAIPVEIGLTDNTNTEILSGITAGTTVITGTAVEIPSNGNGENTAEKSPFMPTPPGRNKK